MKRILSLVLIAVASAWADAGTISVSKQIDLERDVGDVYEIVPGTTYSFRPRHHRFFISGVPVDRNNVGPVERCYIDFMLDSIVIPWADYDGIMGLWPESEARRARLYQKYGIVPLSMEQATVLTTSDVRVYSGGGSWITFEIPFTFTSDSRKQIAGKLSCSAPENSVGGRYEDFITSQFGQYLNVNL